MLPIEIGLDFFRLGASSECAARPRLRVFLRALGLSCVSMLVFVDFEVTADERHETIRFGNSFICPFSRSHPTSNSTS